MTLIDRFVSLAVATQFALLVGPLELYHVQIQHDHSAHVLKFANLLAHDLAHHHSGR